MTTQNALTVIGPAATPLRKGDLAAVGFGLQAAGKLGGACDVLLLGLRDDDAGERQEQVAKLGARKVYSLVHSDLETYTAEAYAAALVEFLRDRGAEGYRVIGAATSSATREYFPRVAAGMDVPMASDVLSIDDLEPATVRFTRAVFVGNLLATVELTGATVLVTCRASEFEAPEESAERAETETVRLDSGDFQFAHPRKRFVASHGAPSDRPDLSEAEVIVSAGRGTKGPDAGIPIVEELVDLLGGALGATRAVVDAEWLPNELQVGQTGKIVAPKLYIAIGISGAIQHLAGMRNSKTVVAINKDPDAPIFEISDVGLVADLFEVVPQMIEDIKKVKA